MCYISCLYNSFVEFYCAYILNEKKKYTPIFVLSVIYITIDDFPSYSTEDIYQIPFNADLNHVCIKSLVGHMVYQPSAVLDGQVLPSLLAK